MISTFARRQVAAPAAMLVPTRTEVAAGSPVVKTPLIWLDETKAYCQWGQTYHPRRGEVITVSDEFLAATLIASGLARRTGLPPTAQEALGWADIDTISQHSKATLLKVAPQADPLTATQEDLEHWLGSQRRAEMVMKGLEAIRESATS